MTDIDNSLDAIKENINEVLQQFEEGEVPEVSTPVRTGSNIVYNEEQGYYELGESTSSTSASSVSGAKKLLQYAYLLNFLVEQLEQEKSSTLREIYYLSESWDNENAQFNSQDSSNSMVENVELMTGLRREDFNIRPEEDGATVIGPLELIEQTKRGERRIHCQEDVGEGGYQIPNDPETIEFIDNDADFVLAVETGGMRDRLVENGFDEEYNAIIVHLKGQPSRGTRILIRLLNERLNLPIGVFADCDPWSFRIFGSVAFGSMNSAYLSNILTTPQADYLGIWPSDIEKYDLPTDELSDSDIRALESSLMDGDPRFQDPKWQEEFQKQIQLNQKCEQQSLASRGLEFVTDTYLPEKLEEWDKY